MGFQKYTVSEGITVVKGEAAAVLNTHLKKVGKRVDQFTPDEQQALQNDLDALEPTPTLEDKPKPVTKSRRKKQATKKIDN